MNRAETASLAAIPERLINNVPSDVETVPTVTTASDDTVLSCERAMTSSYHTLGAGEQGVVRPHYRSRIAE
jgi:hypothetical protein